MNINSFFYSIKLTYYSTSFLCKAMFSRSDFNVVQQTVEMRMCMNMFVHQTMVAKINQTIIFLHCLCHNNFL